MFELDFRDDDYRNSRNGGSLLGLQYFFKRQEGSAWEVYSTYSPSDNLLWLHYYDVYEQEHYPVFFLTLEDEDDAETACNILSMKTDYLWSKTGKNVRHTTDSISSKIRRAGFVYKSIDNNIATWTRSTEDGNYTLMIEHSVSLSIHLFSGDQSRNAKAIFALRNIKEENALEEALAYIKRKV